MAFRQDEPRDRRGRWQHDPMASPSEVVAMDLAVVRRRAYDNVANRMARSQMGEAYPSAFSRLVGRVLVKLGPRAQRLTGRL